MAPPTPEPERHTKFFSSRNGGLSDISSTFFRTNNTTASQPNIWPRRVADEDFFRENGGLSYWIFISHSPARTKQSQPSPTPDPGESREKIFFGRMRDYLIGYSIPILPHKTKYDIWQSRHSFLNSINRRILLQFSRNIVIP